MIEIIQNKNQVKEIMYRGGIYMEETRKIPIREVGTKDKEYPEKLCQYTGMPDKLYVRGNFPDPEKPTAAIVGARAATPYGRIQAFRYAKYLSEAGVQVISGMAYGMIRRHIRGALEGRGGTWAVLGNGRISVIRQATEDFISAFCAQAEESSVNRHRERKARNYFFPARNEL